MSFGGGKTPDLEPDLLPVEDEEVSTHQEAVPVPYLAGTQKIALRWISPALNMVTKQAPDQKAGKK
jgi:hypothetical protein